MLIMLLNDIVPSSDALMCEWEVNVIMNGDSDVGYVVEIRRVLLLKILCLNRAYWCSGNAVHLFSQQTWCSLKMVDRYCR
jgi:hypothetical protein